MAKKRNYEINFLKFIFTIVIMMYHTNKFMPDIIIPKGYLCVEFFFMVSGYFMAASISRLGKYDKATTDLWGENIRFSKRKISSLYPAYLFAFIFCFIIVNIVNERRPIVDVLKNLLMSTGELGMFSASGIRLWGSELNGPTWYISSMVIAMFILYPIARKNVKRFSCYIAPIISVFAMQLSARMIQA